MPRRPSRLWRKLTATEPLFRVWSEDGLDLSDNEIVSITINRGSSSPSAGNQPQTLEVVTTQPLSPRTGFRVHCDLSSYGTNRLMNLTGASMSSIEPRFYGRVGRQTMTDEGPGKMRSTFTASPWQAQLKNIPLTLTPVAGQSVGELLVWLSAPMGIGSPWLSAEAYAPAITNTYGTVDPSALEPINYRDGMQKWAVDLGIYAQTRRDGVDWFVTNEWRWDKAIQGLNTEMPLTRSQAISPATWEQPQENIWRTHRAIWTDGTGGEATASFGHDPQNPNIGVTLYDMRHARFSSNDGQPRSVAAAGYHAERAVGYNVPSLTIDLLHLATSPTPYHRMQAKQLLELQVGDPIYLAGDWNHYLQGIQFAVGLNERITADGWELELQLAPSSKTVGEMSPQVPARVWESAGIAWQDATTNWPNT